MRLEHRRLSRTPRRLDASIAVLALLMAVNVLMTAEVSTVPTFRWLTDAAPVAAHAVGDTLYLGGAFRLIAPATDEGPSFLSLDTAAVSTECATRTGPRGALFRPAVVPDPVGGLFMQTPWTFQGELGRLIDDAGDFVVPVSRSFVRVGPDCRFDRAFQLGEFLPGDPAARGSSILRVGSLIYVGGGRTTGNGDGVGRLVAFDSVTYARVFERDYAAFGAVIVDGALPDGRLLATVRVRGTSSNQLGVLDPQSGAWLRVAPEYSTFVGMVGSRLYFTTIGAPGQLRALDISTGQTPPGWTNPSLHVNDLEAANGVLYIAGYGHGRYGVFAVSEATGDLIADFAPALGQNPEVTRLALVDGALYLRGKDVRSVGGQPRYQLAAVDAQTGAVLPWAPSVFASDDQLVDLVPNGDRLFVGSLFGLDALPRTHLAAVDTSTGEILPFDPNGAAAASDVIPPVYALSANAGALFVGAASLAQRMAWIRRVPFSTGVRDSWRTLVMGTGYAPVPHALAATDSTVYVGGYFSGALGLNDVALAARSHAFSVDIAAERVTAWNPGVGSAASFGTPPVAALALSGSTVVLAGAMTSVGGQARNGLAAVDASLGNVIAPSFTLPASHSVRGLTSDGDTFYFTGFAPGWSGNRFLGSGSIAPASIALWSAPLLSSVYPSDRIAVSGGRLFSGVEWDATTRAPIVGLSWQHPVAVATGVAEVADNSALPHNVVRTHRPAPPLPPGPPRRLSVSVRSHVVDLSWDPPAESSSAGRVLRYALHAGTASGLSDLAVVEPSAVGSFSAAVPAGTYFVRAHARNQWGLSAPSNEVAFTVGRPTCTTAPAAAQGLLVAVTGNRVTLSWLAAVGATSYVIEAGSGPGLANLVALPVAAVPSIDVTAPDGVYYVRVRGVNDCGTGPPSNEAQIIVGSPVVPPGPPGPPTHSVTGSTVTLDWALPTSGGAPDAYIVEAGNGPGLSDLAIVSLAAPPLVAHGVPPGAYFVRIRGRNAAGAGPTSPETLIQVP